MITANKKKNWVLSVASIFWNYNEHRLRLVWRLASMGILAAVLTFILGMPFFALRGGFSAPYVEKIVLYVAIAMAVGLATRFFDRRRFADVGIFLKQEWWLDLGFGLLLGAFLMTIIFLVELSAGWVTVRDLFVTEGMGQPFLVAILLPVLLNLLVGIVEELVFRGYLLLNLAEGFNGRYFSPHRSVIIAWLFTSVIFGVAHGFLPNATVVSTINIVLAGIWLGLVFVLTGSLAASIGAHITWNLFQGYVFGFPVSGGRDFSTSVIAIQQGGPDLWTGGAFGPEGGLLGLLGFVFGILLMAVWVRRRYDRWAVHSALAYPPSIS